MKPNLKNGGSDSITPPLLPGPSSCGADPPGCRVVQRSSYVVGVDDQGPCAIESIVELQIRGCVVIVCTLCPQSRLGSCRGSIGCFAVLGYPRELWLPARDDLGDPMLGVWLGSVTVAARLFPRIGIETSMAPVSLHEF
jgi:hypothetical protein